MIIVNVVDQDSADLFNENVGNMNSLVLFFSLSCGHCKRLKPEWIKMENSMREYPTGMIARIHANMMEKVNCYKNIQGSLRFLH